jgi:phage terminase large subunit
MPSTDGVLRIPTPAVFVPLLEPSRYKGIHGGRGGAKSHFFADQIIERCFLRKPCRAVCVREVQRTLAQSVKRLLEDKIRAYGLEREFRVLTSHIEAPNGGIIIFNGMQDHTAESIKSLEGFDVAWVEEAQSLSQRSLDLLRPTIREKDSELWFSWNPRHATDPVDRLLRSDPPPDSIVIETSYKDNPFFPDVLRKEMEWDRSRDVEKYQHIWLGGYERHSEARVFKNWVIDEFESPADATYYYGADWGFSVDPSTMVRCRLDGRKLFVDYEAYRIGVEIDHLGSLFDMVPGARDWPVRADSARPETISYLQRNGFPQMKPATKGPNSVKEGVIFLQGYDIVVHPRCIHTIDELTMYSYVVDKMSGLVTPVLADKKNHIIDPLRYATEELRVPNIGLTW